MRRWGRDEDLAKADGGFHHWAYVLSLQELFTHLTGIDFDAPQKTEMLLFRPVQKGTMIQDQPWKARRQLRMARFKMTISQRLKPGRRRKFRWS